MAMVMVILIIITDTTMLLPDIMEAEDIGVMTAITIEIILIIIMIMVFLTIMTVTTTPEEKCMLKEGLPQPPPRDLTTVSGIITGHTIIIAEDSIITETPIITVGSETRTAREIRIAKTVAGSEIRTAAVTADSETKAAVLRTTKTVAGSETRTVADSETAKAVRDQNHPAGSETAQAAKAAMPTDRAAEEASDNLDKTIINKETNS